MPSLSFASTLASDVLVKFASVVTMPKKSSAPRPGLPCCLVQGWELASYSGGVAEPVTHYINPPFGQGRAFEAAEVIQAELLPVHAVKLNLHYYPLFHGPYTIRLLSTVPIWW